MSGQSIVPKRRAVKGAGSVRAPKKHDVPVVNTMDKLQSAIQEIQQHNASRLSFEEHYRYAYNLVLHKQGHLLYNKVAELVSTHLEKDARERIFPAFPPSTSADTLASGSTQSGGTHASANVSAAAAGQLFLDRVKDVWDDHYACMGKLRDVLKYMDKMYSGNGNGSTSSSSVPSVWDLGLSLFFHHVVLLSTKARPPKPPNTSSLPSSSRSGSSTSTAEKSTARPTADPTTIAHHLIATLLNIIRIEREGEVVSRHSIHSTVTILSKLTDEGPVPLPLTASAGTGSGSPVLGPGGALPRGKAVMGTGTPGIQESPYKTSFEPALLKQSAEFYKRESAALLVSCDAPTFLKKVNRRLDEEVTRAQTYLAPSTEPLLIRLLEETLITAHLQSILDHPASGLKDLLNDSRIDDLERLYSLFDRVESGPAALRTGVAAWIVQRGLQINEGLIALPDDDEGGDAKGKGKAEVEDDAMAGSKPKPKPKEGGTIGAKTKAALNWVQLVLDLKDKFDTLLKNAFYGDTEMEKSINDAFINFVNQNPGSSESISLFVDENLKKGLKGKSESEVDDVLNKSVAIFRFLVEKDQFERYYNQHLAKRLISSRSVSDDAERNILAKFRVEAGAAITKAAEGMMKDVKTSEESLVEYRRQQAGNPSKRSPFDMAPIVCGQNNWPFSQIDRQCKLPAILMQGIEAYRAFYDTKHSGRKLTFRPDLGSVEVKTRFEARNHELTVSTYGMVVLALFESLGADETLSYTEISSVTEMGGDDLRRTLQSLACAKYKILTKTPKGRDVDDTDVFAFNSKFVCNLAKIKIQTVANKVETSEERKHTSEKLDKERESVCDACIVRVMKDRKQLALTEVVNEVIKQLSRRFTPQPAMIKKAIERLIDKEYLERDANDRKKLRYMA